MGKLARREGFTLVELLTVIGIIAVLAAILFPVFSSARAKARQATCLSNLQQIGVAIESYVQDHAGFLPTWSITHPYIRPWRPPSGSGVNENWPHPTVGTWDTSIMTYLRQDALLICPDNPYPGRDDGDGNIVQPRAYAISQYTQRPQEYPRGSGEIRAMGGYRDDIPLPGETVLLFEKGANPPGAWGDALGQNVYQDHGADMPEPSGEDVGDFDMWHRGGKNFLYLDYHAKWHPATSGPFANKPTEDDSPGMCEVWGPQPNGHWPVP